MFRKTSVQGGRGQPQSFLHADGVQTLAANHLLSRANDMLQSVLVLGSGSMSNDDGGGEDKLMLLLEVLGNDSTQEAEGVHSVSWGVTQRDGGWWWLGSS